MAAERSGPAPGPVADRDLIAYAAHELRSPLNAIIGFADLIASEAFGPAEAARYRDYAAQIGESGRRLLAIVEGILDLAKGEAGKLQIARESVALAAFAAACAAETGPAFAEAGVTLETPPPGASVRALADPVKLRQVLLNLLSNAVKFTEPGGTVSLSVEPRPGGRVAVTVADTGIGIAHDDIALALTPFGQVDNSLARRRQGTGLGLPLAKLLVELQGGELSIASTPGKGTRVTVLLPGDPADPTRPENERQNP